MAEEHAHLEDGVQGPETVNINDLQNALQTLNIAFHEQDAEFYNALANELGVQGLPDNQDEKVNILCHELKKKAVKNIERPLLTIRPFASPMGMNVEGYSRQRVKKLFINQYKYRWMPNDIGAAAADDDEAEEPAADDDDDEAAEEPADDDEEAADDDDDDDDAAADGDDEAPAAVPADNNEAAAADPVNFSFYRFCEVHGNHDNHDNLYRTYNIRRAHVIARLWRAQQRLREIRNLTYRELCPPIYALSLNGNDWAKWTFDNVQNQWTKQVVNIGWITNVVLRAYIQQNSKKKYFNVFPAGENQLYWAVLEEDDHGENVNLPFPTQVYVGKAKNGIQKRWTGSQASSHCKKMELVRNVMYPMVNYNPTALLSLQLVDLRLLLHKASHQNGENTSGLFIMGEYSKCKNMNKAEKRNIKGEIPNRNAPMIQGWKPKDMNYGMNYDYLV